jgi:hypothetical protein
VSMYETYSFRQKQQAKKSADVFTYDELPEKLRVQAARIWSDALDDFSGGYGVGDPDIQDLHKLITTELGVYELGANDQTKRFNITNYFLSADFEEALDILEMMFFGLSRLGHREGSSWQGERSREAVADAVSELNRRFLQHGIGYAFVDGERPQIIRMDNEHLHRDVVLPALMLLSEQGFEGANDEYRKAHKHYQDENIKECLNECLKSFESTMKTICTRRGWSFQNTDTAAKLIEICLQNNLLPTSMKSHLGAVSSLLGSGTPTVRNKMSGHGQGPVATTVPPFFATYLLHETAASIVFLVDAFKALP